MAAESDKIERTVTVSATGRVSAEPDMAQIYTGVVTEADSAKDAIGRNNAVMAKVVDGLKASGIAAKDIQTKTLNVEPRYTQPKDGRAATINGYRVINQLRLTVRDVKRLGEILDQAIALGANQVNNIGFDVTNAETLKDDARKQAMENARRRGELYAIAAGGQLGPALRISERAGDLQPMFRWTRGLAGQCSYRDRHAQPRSRGARYLRPAVNSAMSIEVLVAFIAACVLLGLTPGPNMALIMANTLRCGLRAASQHWRARRPASHCWLRRLRWA